MQSSIAQRWHDFWRGEIGEWIIARGLRIVMLYLIGGLLAVRFVTWVANRITRRIDASFAESDALVRSEATKHRQAVASVISWVSIAADRDLVHRPDRRRSSLSRSGRWSRRPRCSVPRSVSARSSVVQDLLSGFFIIVEKQYGFGDLVQLTMAAVTDDALGTVENVTLRVTRLRSTEGEMFTIPNGQIVKAVNLSPRTGRARWWTSRFPTSANLNRVNEVLRGVAENAMENRDAAGAAAGRAQLMGVESIEVDTVNLRMVARTLPGKQFEAGRQLRVLVVRALRRAGIVTPTRWSRAADGARPSYIRRPRAVAEEETQGTPRGAQK